MFMLADFDAIGAVAIVVIGLVSYVADHMKKQKAEAAARRQLQEEFRQRSQSRKDLVGQAAVQARRLEEKLRREAAEQRQQPQQQQYQPRQQQAPAMPHQTASAPAPAARQAKRVLRPVRMGTQPPAPRPSAASLEESLPDFEVTMPDLETSMPDAEEVARSRMARRAGEAASPLSPSAAAAAEMGSVSASLNDAERAALEALRSGSRTTGARQAAQRPCAAAPTFPGKLDAATIRQAIIYKELLDRPVALRELARF